MSKKGCKGCRATRTGFSKRVVKKPAPSQAQTKSKGGCRNCGK